MNQKFLILSTLIIIIISITACSPEKADMRNPASVFCEEQGGTLEIRTDKDGGQIGYCIFEDGSECEEWAFYRGECIPGDSLAKEIGMPNPASVFCEENGGKLEIRTDESGGQVGFCLFEDGSECEEWAYYRGECKPGDSLDQAIGLPNPASVHCQEKGGKLEIITDAYGNQIGMCNFADGSACEEWAFYRGACVEGGIYPLTVKAEDGCYIYRNERLSYSLHIPQDSQVTSVGDPGQTISLIGPLSNDEHWPMIYVNHPSIEPYITGTDKDLETILAENNLLIEERKEDRVIAGETAIHLHHPRSPQSYASDTFFFIHNDQLFSIVFLHTADKEDWDLYNHFLNSISFSD